MNEQDEPGQDRPAFDKPAFDEPAFDEPAFDEPAFDDPDHAWVRDLLADAKVDTPVPADVAARLDDTLARLRAERGGGNGAPEDAGATVVPLRRRLGPRITAAAAAVILVAAGGVAVARLAGGGSGTSESTGSPADSSRSTAASPSAPGLTGGQAPQALADAPLRLSSASFAADAAAAMRALAAKQTAVGGLGGTLATPTAPVPARTPGGSQSASAAGSAAPAAPQAPPVTATPGGTAADLRAPAGPACTGPVITDAVTLPATLDGARVALLFRRPTATGQRVEAWSCDGSRLLAAATVAR